MDGHGLIMKFAILLAIAAPPSCDGIAYSESYDGSLLIGAFNIQIFGVNKVGKVDVVNILVKILQRYDLVLIQEIRDKSETAIQMLLDALNSERDDKYEMVVSSRLGRSSSKEQYAYFYKPSRLTLLHSYVYNDTANDVFEREPFVAYFESPTIAIDRFAMIGVHVKPSDASEEINQLVNVYDDYINKLGNENAIIAGDFNADCNYLSNTALLRSQLRTDARFEWIIPDDTDTTLAASDCSYDRLVIAGNELFNITQLKKTGVFYFDQNYGLDIDTARDVSDHYPIEMYLQGNLDSQPLSAVTTTSGCSGSIRPVVWVYLLAMQGLLVYKSTQSE